MSCTATTTHTLTYFVASYSPATVRQDLCFETLFGFLGDKLIELVNPTTLPEKYEY